MQSEEEAIGFTPVSSDCLPLLAGWLAAPHMREWWGDPDEEIGFIREMVEGRDTTRPFLILLGDRPIGYIQHWFLGHHQNEVWLRDHPWLAEFPAETVGVDLSIGDPALLSKGLGSTALAAFVAGLRAEGYSDIIIDPDPANHRAIRAYEKAGFRIIPHLQDKTGDVLLMRHGPARTST